MQSTKTSTTVTKKTKNQIEYHLFIYKGERKKSYVWVCDAETLTDDQLIDIANKYFKVKRDELEVVQMYRLGKNIYGEPFIIQDSNTKNRYFSRPISIVKKK